MRATLGQVEAFYWITQLGSFRAAAAKLNLTQPTVSLRVSNLEEALGIRSLGSLHPSHPDLGTSRVGQALHGRQQRIGRRSPEHVDSRLGCDHFRVLNVLAHFFQIQVLAAP